MRVDLYRRLRQGLVAAEELLPEAMLSAAKVPSSCESTSPAGACVPSLLGLSNLTRAAVYHHCCVYVCVRVYMVAWCKVGLGDVSTRVVVWRKRECNSTHVLL